MTKCTRGMLPRRRPQRLHPNKTARAPAPARATQLDQPTKKHRGRAPHQGARPQYLAGPTTITYFVAAADVDRRYRRDNVATGSNADGALYVARRAGHGKGRAAILPKGDDGGNAYPL